MTSGPVLARADGLAAHRQRAHRAVQLAATPATSAARSSCASRTPTSPAPREESIAQIQDTLRWLGLDWDEGPYPPERALRRATSTPRRGCSTRATRTSATAPRTRSRQRNEPRSRAGRPPGYDGRCRDLTADERAALAAEGRPRVDPVPHARRRRQQVHRHHPRRRLGRVVDISDFVIVRSNGHAGLLPRQRGRRPRHGDHARAPGRGPHRLDASRARAAPCARRRRPAGVRAPAADPRAESRRSCRSATARCRSRSSATPGTCPRRSSTTSRCSVGRPPTTAARS